MFQGLSALCRAALVIHARRQHATTTAAVVLLSFEQKKQVQINKQVVHERVK